MNENENMDTDKLALVHTRRTRAITEAKKGQNFLFYKNGIPCKPDGVMIDDLHKSWFGAYGVLGKKKGGEMRKKIEKRKKERKKKTLAKE